MTPLATKSTSCGLRSRIWNASGPTTRWRPRKTKPAPSATTAKVAVAPIAAVAGWSIDYTQRIVDTYLPRRSEVALGAMELSVVQRTLDELIRRRHEDTR